MLAEKNSILNRILHEIEAWLWRRGFQHVLVRQVMKIQIIFLFFSLLIGIIALTWTIDGMTFALGVVIFAHILWGISGQILGFSLTTYSGGLLFLLLFKSGLRLAIAALVLYVAFKVYNASAIVLVCGLTASTAVALGTFAHAHFKRA